MTAPSDSLGKDARALIQAARGGDDVPAAERLRVLNAFARNADARNADAAEPPGTAAAPLARRHRGRAPQLGWAVAALVLTGSLAALAQHQGLFERLGALLEAPPARPAAPAPAVRDPAARRREPAPPAELELAPPAEPELAPPPEPERAPSLEPVPGPARKSTASVRPAAPRSPLASALPEPLDPEELELIAAARTALAERQYDTARQRAERHAQRFPHGAFSEEREAILALSDCRSQRGTERGQRFVGERPGALLAERVRRDCGLGPNLVPGEGEPGTH